MLHLLSRKEPYVKEFVYVPASYRPGRTVAETTEEKELVASLERSQQLAKKLHVLQYLEYEHIFVLIRDLHDFKFTVHIEGGAIKFEVGWDVSKEPTLVVPLRQENIHNF